MKLVSDDEMNNWQERKIGQLFKHHDSYFVYL